MSHRSLMTMSLWAVIGVAADEPFCCWYPKPPADDACTSCKNKDYSKTPSSCGGGTWCGSSPSPSPVPVPMPVPAPVPPPSPVPTPTPGPCQLTPSGPIVVKSDGQVVENLFITTDSTAPGILVQGARNVMIRNVKIQHQAQTEWPYGSGIYFTASDDITIDHVEVELVGVELGPLPDLHNFNIYGQASARPKISNLHVTGGSSGVELSTCPDAHVWNLVAENVRGPYPRGQCLQVTGSDNLLFEDFHCHNDNTSWTEDSISIYRSSNCTVRRGVVDGNNAPNGVGVMFEQDDASKRGGLVEDVDAIRMGDGCFSAYGGKDIRFVRTRCRENHCVGWSGRDPPSSKSLLYAAGDESGVGCENVQIEDSKYFDVCNPDHLTWEAHEGAWTKIDLTESDFQMRDPITVSFCWSQAGAEAESVIV